MYYFAHAVVLHFNHRPKPALQILGELYRMPSPQGLGFSSQLSLRHPEKVRSFNHFLNEDLKTMVLGQRPPGAFSTHLSARNLSGFSPDPKERQPSAQPQEPRPLDQKVVGFINGVMTQGTDFSLVGPMLLAAPAYSVGKLGLLRSMVAKPGATFLSQALKLKALPVMGGFALETAAFGLSSRALSHYFHGPVPWDTASVGVDLAMAGLTLSLLKGAGYAGIRAMQWARGLDGLNPLAWTKADHRALFLTSQVSAYLGLVGSHGLQNKIFPEVHLPGQNIWVDALGAHLALGMGAYAGRRALGEHFHAMERGLALEAHRLYEQSKPSLDISGLPATAMAMAMATGRGGGVQSNLHEINYFIQGDKGEGPGQTVESGFSGGKYVHSESIAANYLGVEIVTELVSKEPLHNLSRMAQALRESLLDILITGAEENIPLKGKIADQLRADPELRKKLLGGKHRLWVRFDAQKGEILDLKLSGEETLEQAIPEASPPPAEHPPAETRPATQEPTPPPESTPDPWSTIEDSIRSLKENIKEKWNGKFPAAISANRLLLFISRVKGQEVPQEEIVQVLDLLRESIHSNKDPNATHGEVRRRWKNLCKVYGLNLFEGQEGPVAEATEKPSGPQRPGWDSVTARIQSLRLKVLNKWPHPVTAKESATGLMKWMPRLEKLGVGAQEVHEILDRLEESIAGDTDGQSQHLEAKELWEKLKTRHDITLFKRGGGRSRRADRKGSSPAQVPQAPDQEIVTAQVSRSSRPVLNLQEKMRRGMREREEAAKADGSPENLDQVQARALVENFEENLPALDSYEKARAVMEFLEHQLEEVALDRFEDSDHPHKYHEDTGAVDLPEEILNFAIMREILRETKAMITRQKIGRVVIWDPNLEADSPGQTIQWFLRKGEKNHRITLMSLLNRMEKKIKDLADQKYTQLARVIRDSH